MYVLVNWIYQATRSSVVEKKTRRSMFSNRPGLTSAHAGHSGPYWIGLLCRYLSGTACLPTITTVPVLEYLLSLHNNYCNSSSFLGGGLTRSLVLPSRQISLKLTCSGKHYAKLDHRACQPFRRMSAVRTIRVQEYKFHFKIVVQCRS